MNSAKQLPNKYTSLIKSITSRGQAEYHEPKPFAKGAVKSPQGPTQFASAPNYRPVSEAFRQKLLKNTNHPGVSQHAQQEHLVQNSASVHRKSATPNTPSRQFRIQKKINPQKLRDDLIKFNTQQSLLQNDILNLHSSHQSSIVQTIKKYQIKVFEAPKQLIKTALDEQIQSIKQLSTVISESHEAVNTIQSKIDRNLFQQFLSKQTGDIFQEERQSEEEADQVDILPTTGPPTQNYANIMKNVKSKKWGLTQRTTFEVHRTMGQSRFASETNNSGIQKNINLSRASNGPQYQQQKPKIIVNSHLKNLLLS